MAGKLKSIATGKKIAKKGLVFQMVMSAILIAVASLVVNVSTGLAIGFGTVISFLPNAVFSLFAFRYSGARQAQAIARSFSQGSKIKLAITTSLFVVAFAALKLPPAPVFIGFIAATTVYWAVLFRTNK